MEESNQTLSIQTLIGKIRLPNDTAEIYYSLALYHCCLDIAHLHPLSELDYVNVVEIFGNNILPALIKNGYGEVINKTYAKISKSLMRDKKASEQARELLSDLQLKYAQTLATCSNSLPPCGETPPLIAQEQFVVLKEQLEGVVANSNGLVHRERGLGQFFTSLEKLIHAMLLGHLNMAYEVQCKYIAEAMQFSCSGLALAQKKHDLRAIERFSSLIDIIFAHYFHLHSICIPKCEPPYLITILRYGERHEKVTQFKQVMQAADALLMHAHLLAQDTHQVTSNIHAILEKAQSLYAMLKDQAILHDDFNEYGMRALSRLSYITDCLFSIENLSIFPFESFNALIPWQENRDMLKTLRARTQNALKNSSIGDTLMMVDEFNQGFKAFILKIFKDVVTFMGGHLPFECALLILGSPARHEACPFSDVEYAFLVDAEGMQNKSIVETVLRLFEICVFAIGETPTSQAGLENMLPIGFQFDNIYVAVKNLKRAPFQLWGTKEILLGQLQDPYLGNILTNAEVLWTSEKGLSLYNAYKADLGRLDCDFNQGLAKSIVGLNKVHLEPFTETNGKINGKTDFLHAAVLWLTVFNFNQNLNATRSLDRLKKLESLQKITSLTSEMIQLVLIVGLRLRFLTHFYYEAENDTLELNPPSNFLDNKIVDALLSLRRGVLPFLYETYENLNQDIFAIDPKKFLDCIPALLILAEEYLSKGNWLAAIKYYNLVLEIDDQHVEAAKCHEQLVQQLRNHKSYQPMFATAIKEKEPICQALLSAVKTNNYYQCCRLIFEEKADIFYQDSNGFSVLHVANTPKMMQFLLEQGANKELTLQCQGYQGFTPLHWHTHKMNVELVALLLKLGAKVDAVTTKMKLTALHIAAQVNSPNCPLIELLMEYGGNARARDAQGKFAISCVNGSENKDISQFAEVFLGKQAAIGIQAKFLIEEQQKYIGALESKQQALLQQLETLKRNHAALKGQIETLETVVNQKVSENNLPTKSNTL